MLITGPTPPAVFCGPGDSISIALSRRAKGEIALEVWAVVDGLESLVGELRDTTPGSRVIAVATVPGASHWRVVARMQPGDVAELTISPSPYPCGPPGLVDLTNNDGRPLP